MTQTEIKDPPQPSGRRSPRAPVRPAPIVVPAPAVVPEHHPRPRIGWALALAVGTVFAVAIVLRFWTRSELWLDEAQTVAIARLPLARIGAALRHDGSPPLYYYLLHLWMRAFGTSDVAVRSLSGVLGVAALPLMWLSGRRLGARADAVLGSGGRAGFVAWAATLLLAVSPFAVRYSTETRMYMLVVVLVLCGYLVLTAAMAKPTLPRLTAVAVLSGLLQLSHYWCFYLLAAVGVMLLWASLRPTRGVSRLAATESLCALVLGSALLAVWVPSFRFQLLHTGTPWAPPAYPGNLGTTISDYFGMGTNLGRVLGYMAFGLALFGLFGRAVDRTHVDFDLRGRPVARPLAFVFIATLGLAVVGSQIFGGAYAPRYSAVVLVPFLFLVALGLSSLADRRARGVVLALMVVGSLAAAVPNVVTQRTQARDAAAIINRSGSPGDAVVYCPDQLAPAMNRLLRPGRFAQFPYPGGSPAMVDWVDYAARFSRSDPAAFARTVVATVGPSRSVWVVWSPDYPPTVSRCTALLTDLEALLPVGHQVIGQDTAQYYEHEFLERLSPAPHPPRRARA